MSDIEEFPISLEKRSENVIASARSFDELIDAIDELGRIKGADGHVYSADDLINLIGKIKGGELSTDYITRTSGLRNKVTELIQADGHIHSNNVLKDEQMTDNFETISQDPTIRFLLGTYFASENSNQVQRGDGINYVFSREQLQRFLKKYSGEAGLRQFIDLYKSGLEKELESETDSLEKAGIRRRISRLTAITEEEILQASATLYS